LTTAGYIKYQISGRLVKLQLQYLFTTRVGQ